MSNVECRRPIDNRHSTFDNRWQGALECDSKDEHTEPIRCL